MATPSPNQEELLVLCAGVSMAPTLQFGDQVRVTVPASSIRAGDVVLFRCMDGVTHVMHRVVFKVPALPWFVHVGDSPRAKDVGLARTSQVVGQVQLPRRLPPMRMYAQGVDRVLRAARRYLIR